MKLQSVKPIIYVITKGEATDANLAETGRQIIDLVRAAVAENISLIQIREKNLSARSLFELTETAAAITRGSRTQLLVNDRADIALAARASGVHLTAESLPIAAVRDFAPPGFLVGISAHTPEEVFSAERLGADFALYGPVFETPGKGQPVGADSLAAVSSVVPNFCVIGVGGINASNWQSVLAAGAAGCASIRWLNGLDALRLASHQIVGRAHEIK